MVRTSGRSSTSSGLYWWAKPIRLYSCGIAGQLPVEAGHADQDQAEIAAVEEVAELFEAGGLEAVGLVDDDQFGAAVGVELGPAGVTGRVQGLVDVSAESRCLEGDLHVHPPAGDVDLRGVHQRAACQQSGR